MFPSTTDTSFRMDVFTQPDLFYKTIVRITTENIAKKLDDFRQALVDSYAASQAGYFADSLAGMDIYSTVMDLLLDLGDLMPDEDYESLPSLLEQVPSAEAKKLAAEALAVVRPEFDTIHPSNTELTENEFGKRAKAAAAFGRMEKRRRTGEHHYPNT